MDFDETIYMVQSNKLCFGRFKGYDLKIKKSIYGHKQES